jgi:hypothetical protein
MVVILVQRGTPPQTRTYETKNIQQIALFCYY